MMITIKLLSFSENVEIFSSIKDIKWPNHYKLHVAPW